MGLPSAIAATGLRHGLPGSRRWRQVERLRACGRCYGLFTGGCLTLR
jgi:hypothetical protein